MNKSNRQRLSLFASIILSLFGFVALAPNTYALDMSHKNMSVQACSISCSNTRTAASTQPVVIENKSQDDLPTPPITEPYFVQFIKHHFEQIATPKNLITTPSYRPPDINRLQVNFKF